MSPGTAPQVGQNFVFSFSRKQERQLDNTSADELVGSDYYNFLYKIATFKKTTVIGQTKFIITPQCTQPTSHVCTIYQHMHTTLTSTVILFLAKSNKFADKLESASRSKKVNCLNFKQFFQLSLLEMISILVDSFRFLSLVVIQILNQ